MDGVYLLTDLLPTAHPKLINVIGNVTWDPVQELVKLLLGVKRFCVQIILPKTRTYVIKFIISSDWVILEFNNGKIFLEEMSISWLGGDLDHL